MIKVDAAVLRQMGLLQDEAVVIETLEALSEHWLFEEPSSHVMAPDDHATLEDFVRQADQSCDFALPFKRIQSRYDEATDKLLLSYRHGDGKVEHQLDSYYSSDRVESGHIALISELIAEHSDWRFFEVDNPDIGVMIGVPKSAIIEDGN